MNLFLLIAALTCRALNDREWICEEDYSQVAPDDPAYEGKPYYCTNCVYLTVEQCNYNKQLLTYSIDSVLSESDLIEEQLRDLDNTIYNGFLKDMYEGNLGDYLDWSSISTTSGTDRLYDYVKGRNPEFSCVDPNQCWTAEKRQCIIRFLLSDPFYSRFVRVPNGFDPLVNSTIQFQYAAGFESLQALKTYIEEILPVQGDSIVGYTVISDVYVRLNSLRSAATNLKSTCDSMDCTPRTVSFPSSGGGSGGSGGSSAICEQLLEQILSEIKVISSKAKALQVCVDNIDKNVKEILTVLKSSNDYLGRIDNFVANDLSNAVKKVVFYTNRMMSYTNDLEIAFNTVKVLNSSTNALDVLEFSTNNFDTAKYTSFDWFSRIEASLLRIALKDETLTTNDFEEVSIDSLKDTEDQIKELSFSETSETFLTVLQQFQRTFDKLARLFTDEHRLPNSLDLGISFGGDETLKFDIPQDIAMACRVVSQLLWNVLFGIIAFKLFLFVYNIVIRVFIFRILYKLIKDVL